MQCPPPGHAAASRPASARKAHRFTDVIFHFHFASGSTGMGMCYFFQNGKFSPSQDRRGQIKHPWVTLPLEPYPVSERQGILKRRTISRRLPPLYSSHLPARINIRHTALPDTF